METAGSLGRKSNGINDLGGVGDGSRTRDFRIHNPALYP